MAMSHENCDHPRTPAGRAKCRAAGGPGNATTSAPKKATKPTAKKSRKRPTYSAEDAMIAHAKTQEKESAGKEFAEAPEAEKYITGWLQCAHDVTGVEVQGPTAMGTDRVWIFKGTRGAVIVTLSANHILRAYHMNEKGRKAPVYYLNVPSMIREGITG